MKKIPIHISQGRPRMPIANGPQRLQPKDAAAVLSRMLNNLADGQMVTVERTEFELPPEDGWRRLVPANTIVVRIHPPLVRVVFDKKC